jgi:hypothetical protein
VTLAPLKLPARRDARLPATYEAAKAAIARCEELDECKEWADKAAALASYAKQAGDKELETRAARIRARAYKRCGELLREYPEHPGGRPGKLVEAAPQVSRSQAARDAGLSRDQKVTALRVDNVPDDEFEEAVEAEKPATVTQLAERGKRAAVVDLKGRDPKDFQLAIKAFGHLERLAEFVASADPAACARGQLPPRRADMAQLAREIEPWLRRLIKECSK